MSLPEFPSIDPPLTREDAINQIISSIAMEELALSHIINAEGEKLQYVLGTIPGSTGPQPTIEQVLEVNESIRAVLSSTAEVQTALRSKLQTALSSPVMRGPTGATGATGADGEDGVLEAAGFQANMNSTISTIAAGETFVFNQVAYQDATDISYDTTTGIITVNQDKKYSYYLVNYWFFSEGAGDIPYSVSINVDGTPYSTLDIIYTETQIQGSAIVPAGAESMTLTLTNSSTTDIDLPDDGSQAQITILGFKA